MLGRILNLFSKLEPINTVGYEIGQVKDVTAGNVMIFQERQKIVETDNFFGFAFSPTGFERRISKFSQELVYGGKVGSRIKILYREYSGDIARSPFFQDLHYDLNESNEISFKNFQNSDH